LTYLLEKIRTLHLSIDIPLERLSLEPLDFQEGDIQSDNGTEASWHNDSAVLHYKQREDDLVWGNDDWVHDDAVVHFDPDEQNRPLPRKLSPSPSHIHTPSATLNSVSPTRQDPEGQGKGRKPTKPRSKKKADVQPNNPTQITEVDDAEFKSKMLNAIREDDELYHRILRYDPIPLDDFVALAVILDFPTRGLQSKVTKFLDDQAVHFQAPASGNRR